ncbi:uncharacterized protein CC84DRAFT_1119501, partial [Paraphaeosphaeria sporulosa]
MRSTPTQAPITRSPECLDPLSNISNEALNLDYDPMAWTFDTDQMQFPSNARQFGLGVSGINWLSPHFADGIDLDTLFAGMASSVSVQGLPDETIHRPGIMENRSSAGALLQGLSESDKGTGSSEYYVAGDGGRAPFKGRSHRRGSVLSSVPSHESGNEGSVPSPLLHNDVVSSLCPFSAYENLCQAIAAETCKQGDDRSDLRIPTHEQMQIHVGRYFQSFHPIFPFLRRASFANDSSEEWLLLLAVSMIGSKLTNRPNHHEEEDSIFQLLGKALQRQWYGSLPECHSGDRQELFVPGEPTRCFRNPPNLRVLQAGVLNVICMLHSGEKDLIERALDDRYRLVEACNSLCLLSEDNENIALNVGMHCSEEAIKKWIVRETRIRTGMIIWLLDSIFVYTLQEKPLMRLEDAKTILPSHEESYEDVDILRTGKRLPCNMTMPAALETIYIEKTLPTDLGEFSHVLLINAIYRHTKEILEREQNRLNTWTPTALKQHNPDNRPSQMSYPPTTPTAAQWRNSACDCLDVLHWVANSKVARSAGFEHHTILHLHLARITILTPIKSIQSYATHTKSLHDPPETRDNQALYTARFELLHWVIRDQCKARLSIIHCSALYWHVRRYSCDSISEPYAIYIATLVLWAYSSCLNLPEVVATTIASSGQDVEPSFLHLDRPIDDELVQAFVREGNKMAAYISKIGDIRNHSAPAKILKEGIALLAGSSQPSPEGMEQSDEICYTWGIERSYVGFLRQLS